MTLLSPSEIFFSQDSISYCFGQRTDHAGISIGTTLNDIRLGKSSINDIPTIRVIKKKGKWVTADNRRLWIFKKLQSEGKCEKIPVKVIHSLHWKKCHVRSNIRVRSNESGSAETRSMDQEQDSTCVRTIKKVPLYGRSINDEDVPEVQVSVRSSIRSSTRSYRSTNGSREYSDTKPFQAWEPGTEPQHEGMSLGDYRRYDNNRTMKNATTESYPRRKGYYVDNSSTESSVVGIDAGYSREPANACTRKVNRGEIGDSYTSENPSMEQRCAPLDRNITSKYTPTAAGSSSQTKYDPILHESETERLTRSVSACRKLPSHNPTSCRIMVPLKPLNIGFALKEGKVSIDWEPLGKTMNKWFPYFDIPPIEGFKYSLNVFEVHGRYYSEEVLKLWLFQAMERYTNNVKIIGSVIQTPANIEDYHIGDSLISVERLSGERWRSLDTLKMLTTKRKRSLSLCDIFYSRNAIQDTLNGRSIIKAPVEIFSDQIRDHELDVMEFENKYYTLENEKLWVLKHAEKVLGKFNITGNVKISMDYIMFHSFTTKGIEKVNINSIRDVHTDEQRFMLKYIERQDEEPQ